MTPRTAKLEDALDYPGSLGPPAQDATPYREVVVEMKGEHNTHKTQAMPHAEQGLDM